MKFGEFSRTLPLPCSLHVFKMNPLRGHSLLVLDSKLVLATALFFFIPFVIVILGSFMLPILSMF